jgi:hypothetical protein
MLSRFPEAAPSIVVENCVIQWRMLISRTAGTSSPLADQSSSCVQFLQEVVKALRRVFNDEIDHTLFSR